MEKASGKKIKFEVEGRRKGDLQSVYANAGQAKKLLDWAATRTLDEACRDGWNWEMANVEGRV